jgi:hypothetical protein
LRYISGLYHAKVKAFQDKFKVTLRPTVSRPPWEFKISKDDLGKYKSV